MIILILLIEFVGAKCNDCFKNTTYCANDVSISFVKCECQSGSQLITASDGSFACLSQSCLSYGAFLCNTTNSKYCCSDGFFINIIFDSPSCGFCAPKIQPGQIKVQNCNGSMLTCNNDTSCKATKPYCGLVNGYPTNFSSYDCFLYEANLNVNVPNVNYYYGYFGTCCPSINYYRFSTCDSTECSACNQCILFLYWQTINYGNFLQYMKSDKKREIVYDGCYPNQIISYNTNSNTPFCFYSPLSEYFYNYDYHFGYEMYTCTNTCSENSELIMDETCSSGHCCQCPSESIKCNLDNNGLCYSPSTTSCYTNGKNFLNIIEPNCDCSLTKISDLPCPADCGGLDDYSICNNDVQPCQGRCSSMENGIAQTTCIGLNKTQFKDDHKFCNLCNQYKQIGVGCLDTILDGKCSTILYYQCGSCLYTGPQQNCACNISIIQGQIGQQICAFCPPGSTLNNEGICQDSTTVTVCNDGSICPLSNVCCVNFFDQNKYECVDLSSNSNYCGSCDNPCNCGTDCSNGVCLNSDPNCQKMGVNCGDSGLTCCINGCTNILSSISNCGECSFLCDQIGTECCEGQCNDLSSNIDTCGSCTNSCQDSQICENCTCIGNMCDPGLTLCDGLCVDITSDPFNCGSCEYLCSNTDDDICCDGICYNSTIDPNNCGDCGNICSENLNCCSGRCTDITSDPSNCDGCGNLCSKTDDNICCDSMCYNSLIDSNNCGHCFDQCTSPYSNCCLGICVDITSNPSNCGMCGHSCSNTGNNICCDEICYNSMDDPNNCGSCGNICSENLTCCSGKCVDTSSNPSNCGICNNVCDLGDLCCTGTCININIDPDNCGSCGSGCTADYPNCCNQVCVNENSDLNNCGSCGNICPTNNNCCNGLCFDNNDFYHCGGCDIACPCAAVGCPSCGLSCTCTTETCNCNNGICVPP